MLTTDSLAHVIIRLGVVYRRSHHEGEVGRLARSSPSSSWQAREAAIAHKAHASIHRPSKELVR
jgi:hypothetical protein